MVAEATIQVNCLALKWVAQRTSGTPEDQITYHPHRNVRRFINEGWEEMGRREEEIWREKEAEKRRSGEEEGRERKERTPERRRGENKGKKGKDREAERGERPKNEEEWKQLRRREREYLKDCQDCFKLKKD